MLHLSEIKELYDYNNVFQAWIQLHAHNFLKPEFLLSVTIQF